MVEMVRSKRDRKACEMISWIWSFGNVLKRSGKRYTWFAYGKDVREKGLSMTMRTGNAKEQYALGVSNVTDLASCSMGGPSSSSIGMN